MAQAEEPQLVAQAEEPQLVAQAEAPQLVAQGELLLGLLGRGLGDSVYSPKMNFYLSLHFVQFSVFFPLTG